jgi:hypothetical protein
LPNVCEYPKRTSVAQQIQQPGDGQPRSAALRK